jgi:hypothetical protein
MSTAPDAQDDLVLIVHFCAFACLKGHAQGICVRHWCNVLGAYDDGKRRIAVMRYRPDAGAATYSNPMTSPGRHLGQLLLLAAREVRMTS